MKLLFCFALILSSNIYSKIIIFDTNKNLDITNFEFLTSLPDLGQIVLGESHYQKNVQKMEEKIIRDVVNFLDKKNSFSVCWEFLDYTKQNEIDMHFYQFMIGTINNNELLDFLFPNSKTLEHYKYKYFLNALKDLGGDLIATNAPRKWKRIITASGVKSLDADKVPVHYEIGSENYHARFKKVMGNHVPKEKIALYFEAQSYTDSVIANSVKTLSSHHLNFLIIGSFHSDYNDGVIREINKIMERPTVSIKIIDITKMNKMQIQKLKTPDPIYGPLADYLYFYHDEI